MSSLLRRFRRLRRDDRGAVAVIFALSVLPMLGLAGAAIDMSTMARAKSRMQQVADAAALAAIRAYSPPSYQPSEIDVAAQRAIEKGQNFFQANVASEFIDSVPEISLNLSDDMSVISYTLTYHGVVPTSFMSMFGVKEAKFSGTATASRNLPDYIDVYFVMDSSTSMNRPVTADGLNEQKSRTLAANGADWECTCACHETIARQGGMISGDYENTWDLAKKSPAIPLAIDYAKAAMLRLMDTPMRRGLFANAHFAFYQITDAQLPVMTNDLTPDYTAVGASINAAQATGTAGRYASVLENLSSNMTIQAQYGKWNGSRKAYLFFVTDGVVGELLIGANYVTAYSLGNLHGRSGRTFDPAWCQPFKDKNVTVGVILTRGYPDPGEPLYDFVVAPLGHAVETELRACASSTEYFVDTTENPTGDVAQDVNGKIDALASSLYRNMGVDESVKLTK
jgi:Putative Flp pilus-assembly TadE/G-like